jgi:hypothetical protein
MTIRIRSKKKASGAAAGPFRAVDRAPRRPVRRAAQGPSAEPMLQVEVVPASPEAGSRSARGSGFDGEAKTMRQTPVPAPA